MITPILYDSKDKQNKKIYFMVNRKNMINLEREEVRINV